MRTPVEADRDPNKHWLGEVQPTGIVVTASALAAHALVPAQQTKVDTEAVIPHPTEIRPAPRCATRERSCPTFWIGASRRGMSVKALQKPFCRTSRSPTKLLSGKVGPKRVQSSRNSATSRISPRLFPLSTRHSSVSCCGEQGLDVGL